MSHPVGIIGAMTALEARILASPLRDHAAELLALTRPAVELHPLRQPRSSRPGGTSSGGMPDVGPDFDWPRAHDERPLSFLLQLDLAELTQLPAAAPLPTSGLLSFFYDTIRQPWGLRHSEIDLWRVVYTPGDVPLRRWQSSLPRLTARRRLPEVALVPHASDTLPHQLPFDYSDFYDIDCDPEHAYSTQVLPPDDLPVHQVLGYPRPIQHDDHGVASGTGDEWVSLLQLDTDHRLGTSFGDCGKLHWYIRIDDLLCRRFDAVHVSLQCC